MAVSPGDPFWLLCAIRRVMSAGRDFLVSTDNHVIQLWDLRVLRDRLQSLDLGWDAPIYSSDPDSQKKVPALQVTVRPGKEKPIIK